MAQVEGPWHFEERGKVKFGTTVPIPTVAFMDRAVESGFFANRSDFIGQALMHLVNKINKKEWGELDEILKEKITEFSRERKLKKWSAQAADKKIKVGVSVPPLQILFMDLAVMNGYFENRSDFATHALESFVAYLKKIGLDTVLDSKVQIFYEFLFRE